MIINGRNMHAQVEASGRGMPILNEASAENNNNNTPTTGITNQTEAPNYRGISSRVTLRRATARIECLICMRHSHAVLLSFGVELITQLLPTTSFMGWKQVASKKTQERDHAIVRFELKDSESSVQELGSSKFTATGMHIQPS